MTSGVTLEAWVKPASGPGGWRDVVYRGDDNYFLNTNAENVYGAVTVSPPVSMVGSDATLLVGTWTHIAMSYDGSTLKVYVNGVLAEAVSQTGTIVASTSPLSLGGDPLYGQYFDGVIDEVRVYNRGLTQAEIVIDMNTPVAGGVAPLMNTSIATSALAAGAHDAWSGAGHSMGTGANAVDREPLASPSASAAANAGFLIAFGQRATVQNAFTPCSDEFTGGGYVGFVPDGQSGTFKGFVTPRDGPVLSIARSRDGTAVYYTRPCVVGVDGIGRLQPRILADVKTAGAAQSIDSRLVFAGPPLRSPVALTTDDNGNLIVGDNVADSLFRLSTDFGTLSEFFRLPVAARAGARDLALTRDVSGDVIVATIDVDGTGSRGVVVRVGSDGSATELYRGPRILSVGGAASTREGEIVVADYKQSRLVWLDASGRVVRSLADRRFATASGLTLDSRTGNLVVAIRTTAVDQASLIAVTPTGRLVSLSTEPLGAPNGITAIESSSARLGQLLASGRSNGSSPAQPVLVGPAGSSVGNQPAAVTNRGRVERAVLNSFGITGATSSFPD
jgi:streptogramin lyase